MRRILVADYAKEHSVSPQTIKNWLKSPELHGGIKSERISSRRLLILVPEAGDNGKPEVAQSIKSPPGLHQARESTESQEAPVKIDGVGMVVLDNELRGLLLKKAKVVIQRQIDEVSTGIVTQNQVDEFRSKERGLVDRESTVFSLEVELQGVKQRVEESKVEFEEQRDNQHTLEIEWKEHFRAGLHDLEVIREYYREVVRVDKKAVEILDPKLQLNPEWLNEDAVAIESGTGSEDDIIE